MKMIKLLCAILLVSAIQVLPQKETPPKGSTPKDFKLAEPVKITLDNGMQATLVNYGAIPKVTIRLTLRTGTTNENGYSTGIAGFTFDLLDEGTKTMTASQLADNAARMGGQVSSSGGNELSNITVDVLADYVEEALKMIADVVMNPAFNESDIERLKKDYIRNISINENVPQNIADREFRKLMYGDHPLGKEATQDDVAKYTRAEVEKFYKENIGALRAHIYISGNYDIKKAGESVKKYFNGWAKGNPVVKNIPKLNNKKELVVVERAGAPQSTINLGCPVVDISNPDYMKLSLMNTMLGGSFGSRITSNIREDKGYTYSPGSSVISRYRTAFWLMEADVTTSATGPSLTEIYYEIRRLQNENPSESELDGIKNYSAGIFVLQNSTRQGVISQLANLDLHELPSSYLTDYVKNIYAVTPSDISSAAKKYIDLKKMSLVVVGDKSVITEQLKAFDTDFPKN